MSNKKGYSIIEGCVRQSNDLPLNTWNVESRKGGAEIYVECKDHSVFVGEGYSMLEYGKSMRLAQVIAKALNEYEKEYECHDKGTNAHLDGH